MMAGRLRGQDGTVLELNFSLCRNLLTLKEQIVPHRRDTLVAASPAGESRGWECKVPVQEDGWGVDNEESQHMESFFFNPKFNRTNQK